MAIKVMVATAIASGALEKGAPARKQEPGAAPRPKRRRSSVYDADGNEVFITLLCLKCRKMRPLSQFGLRKMADGAIRNQPWCRTCRSGAGADKPERKRAAPAAEPSVVEASPSAPADPAADRHPGNVAAEVAAALAGGMRR